MKILVAAITLSLTLFGCGGGGEDTDASPIAALNAAKAKTTTNSISSKEFTAFSIGGISGRIDGASIMVVLPIGASRTNRIANFSTTGGTVKVGSTVQISGLTTNNFNTPITYTITALDGSVSTYSVAVALTSFTSNWETSGSLTGAGKWGWLQAVAPYSFQRVSSPVRDGTYAARIEVRPGDDPINSSGERAEVSTMRSLANLAINENEASGTQFYALSFQVPPDWQMPAADANGKWAIILQLHGNLVLGTSPAFALDLQDGLRVNITAGDIDNPAKSLKYKSFPLSNPSLNPGHWVDLIIKIKFTKDFTGAVTVWRHDEGQAGYTQVLDLQNVPTLQYRSSETGTVVLDHYWKHGLYRSKQTTITNVLWLDGLTRYSYQ